MSLSPEEIFQHQVQLVVTHDQDGETEYSEETIVKLLKEAEDRLKNKAAVKKSRTLAAEPSSIALTKLLKLEPGTLPDPYIYRAGNISKTCSTAIPTSLDRKLTEKPKALEDPVMLKKRLKEEKEKTAGSDWFGLPRTNLTPEVKRDLQLIKLRGVLDPKRHYKKDKLKDFPKYSQMGVVIEGNTEFYSARLNKRDRKETLLEEVLSSKDATARFKNKYKEIQAARRSGRKEHFKKLKERRRSKS